MKKEVLKSHIKQIRGVSYKSGQSIDQPKNGYLPVLRSNNIEESNLNFENLVYVPSTLIKEDQKLKKGDILITASTGSIKVIGKNGYVNDDFEGSFGAFCKVVRPLESVLPVYLKHFFQSSNYRSYIRSVVNGANINNIKTGHIDDLKIPLPPLEQQKQIAKILDTADIYRQKTKALIEKYDILTQSLFLEMFGDPVTNPKGWDNIEMGELAELKMGGTPSTRNPEYYKDGDINWMKSGDIKGDFISSFPNKITRSGLENSSAKLYKKNTVVIALNGQGKTRATTGIITSDSSSNQSVANIDPNHLLNHVFLHYQLKSRYKLLRNLTGDNDRSGLNLTILRNYKIHVPSIKFQNQFEERVNAIEVQKKLAQQELEKVEELFQSLLQKAFKGELV